VKQNQNVAIGTEVYSRSRIRSRNSALEFGRKVITWKAKSYFI